METNGRSGYRVRLERKVRRMSKPISAQEQDITNHLNEMKTGKPTWVAPMPSEIADAARVVAWARDPNRKPANTAFTAGPERQAAYWIEWTEQQIGKHVPSA